MIPCRRQYDQAVGAGKLVPSRRGWDVIWPAFPQFHTSYTRAFSIHVTCRSVHVVQTRQLLKDVPQQPGAMYQTYELADKSTYRLRVRTPSQEWWNPRSWNSSLQSVVVKGRRCGGYSPL